MWYKNGQTYMSQQAIRNDNKPSSLPNFLSDEVIESLGYVEVVLNGYPDYSQVQTIQDGGVQLVDGLPTQVWNVVDMFADTAEYTGLDGIIVPARTKAEHEAQYLAMKQADAMAQVVQHFTDTTTAYIEAKVQAYNVANGLAFKDIDAFTKYAVTPTSIHNVIAVRFIGYADKVWNAVRTYQATATTIPTDEQFKAVLDGVVF